MAPYFAIDEAYLVATWLAASLWGVFTVVFIACMVTTFTRRDRNILLKFNIFLIIVMYALATAHISLVLTRAIEGFIKHAQDIGSVAYFADIGQPVNRSKDMIYVTLIFLGDFVVLWRCYTVWNGNLYVTALSAIMVIGTAISGYVAIGHFFLPSPDADNAVAWAIAMLAISMTTNIILTLLTAGRIWYMSRGLTGLSSRAKYNRVLFLIVESGLVMSISKITEFVLFQIAPVDGLTGLNALYIVMDSMPQIMGICPTFIIMAVNRGFTSSNATDVHLSGRYRSAGSEVNVSLPPFTDAKSSQTMASGSSHSTLGGRITIMQEVSKI